MEPRGAVEPGLGLHPQQGAGKAGDGAKAIGPAVHADAQGQRSDPGCLAGCPGDGLGLDQVFEFPQQRGLRGQGHRDHRHNPRPLSLAGPGGAGALTR